MTDNFSTTNLYLVAHLKQVEKSDKPKLTNVENL